MSIGERNEELVRITSDVVAAYVSNNPVPQASLSGLIADVYASFGKLETQPLEQAVEPKIPAVPVKKSITDEYIICLENGKKFKSLKRHLATHHNMTPDEYRAKWGLAADYPMVAPSYAAKRSAMAKKMGLGRKA